MTINWKSLVSKNAQRWLSKTHTPLFLKEIGWRLIVFVAKCGQSNPLSFVLRPAATHKGLRASLGVVLALFALIGAVYGPMPSLAGENTGGSWELAVMEAGEVSVDTEESIKQPLPNIDVSQKFWLFHAGVDLRSPVGTEINPVMNGLVTTVKNERFGYGKYVIVTHVNGYESLYAHMSKISVVEGQEVSIDTELGEVGSTGRSTGPHLHIEIHEDGKSVNPGPILGI